MRPPGARHYWRHGRRAATGMVDHPAGRLLGAWLFRRRPSRGWLRLHLLTHGRRIRSARPVARASQQDALRGLRPAGWPPSQGSLTSRSRTCGASTGARPAVEGDHDYVRHGTTMLFAALEFASGKVTDASYPRHRRQEFLKFLKKGARAYPRLPLHIGAAATPRISSRTCSRGWRRTRRSRCTSPRPIRLG